MEIELSLDRYTIMKHVSQQNGKFRMAEMYHLLKSLERDRWRPAEVKITLEWLADMGLVDTIIAQYLNKNILGLVQDKLLDYEKEWGKEAREGDPVFCEEVSMLFPDGYPPETSEDGDIIISWHEKLDELKDLHHYEYVYFWDIDFFAAGFFYRATVIRKPGVRIAANSRLNCNRYEKNVFPTIDYFSILVYTIIRLFTQIQVCKKAAQADSLGCNIETEFIWNKKQSMS